MPDSALLYESLFLLAHDRAGRSHIHPGMVRAGLVSAILIDLALAGQLAATPDGLQPLSRQPVGEAVLDSVYAPILRAHEDQGARFWIETLAGRVYEPVRDHLLATAVLRPEAGKRFGLLRVTRHAPADPDMVDGIEARLRYELRGHRDLTPYTSAMCGLVRTLRLWPKLHLEPAADADVDRFMAANDPTASHVLAAFDAVVTDTAVGMYR